VRPKICFLLSLFCIISTLDIKSCCHAIYLCQMSIYILRVDFLLSIETIVCISATHFKDQFTFCREKTNTTKQLFVFSCFVFLYNLSGLCIAVTLSLSLCLPVCLSVCLSVWLWVWTFNYSFDVTPSLILTWSWRNYLGVNNYIALNDLSSSPA
jgi:hypothetical protein